MLGGAAAAWPPGPRVLPPPPSLARIAVKVRDRQLHSRRSGAV